MAANFSIKEPSTVYIKNIGSKKVNVFLTGLKLPYFFRTLDDNTKEIKFNLCHVGSYVLNTGDIVKIVPIEINPLKVILPEPDRQRMKPFNIVRNSGLNGTPARNFTGTGLIETGNKFTEYPFAVRVFILLHEVGHFYYFDETLCDLFAAKKFIEMGYNNSTALYSLSQVLNCNSDRNKERVLKLFKHLNK